MVSTNSFFGSRPRALASFTLLLAAWVIPQQAAAVPGYVRSNAGAPWGSNSNEQAMDTVFGAGNWDDLRFETVNPAVLFSPTYQFIYLEGSDNNALELQAFLLANQAALEAWVNAGGTLFLNAGPNEGGNQNWGFGGVTLLNGDFPSDPGLAVDGAHPIWNGPFVPTSLMFTGGYYAHATVTGPGLVPLIIDSDGGSPNLAELDWGGGRVIFGGLTTANFWSPVAECQNLRANIIAYLAAGDGDGDGLNDFEDNCPAIFNPLQEDLDGDDVGDVCDVCIDDPGNDPDADLVCSGMDNCPLDANPPQTDSDVDGVGDVCDPCPADPGNDVDADEICSLMDNCPDAYNPTQVDQDMDGLGAVCDTCPLDADNDGDGDGLCADADNCRMDTNPAQDDADGDGVGDSCDACPGDDDATADADGDGVCLSLDNCPFDDNPRQTDTDRDGTGDACDDCPADVDDDIDADGVCGDVDNCPDDANADQADADGDGMGDACDEAGETGDSTGADETAGPSDTGEPGDTGTEPGTTSGTPGDGSSSGGDGSSGTGSGGEEPTDGGGCACTSSARGSAPGWLLLLLGAVGLRRRRRAA